MIRELIYKDTICYVKGIFCEITKKNSIRVPCLLDSLVRCVILMIIIFIYRRFTTSAQPDIPCKLFKTYLPMGPHLLVGFIC